MHTRATRTATEKLEVAEHCSDVLCLTLTTGYWSDPFSTTDTTLIMYDVLQQVSDLL